MEIALQRTKNHAFMHVKSSVLPAAICPCTPLGTYLTPPPVAYLSELYILFSVCTHERLSVLTYFSQGSVATRLRCSGMFNDWFIAKFLESVSVKEL